MKPFTATTLIAVTLASGCVKEWGDSAQKGLDAEKQAKQIVAASPWQKPTNEMAAAAIRGFESAKGDVQALDITSLTPADQADRYVVHASVNGADRVYLLARDAAGTWTASDKLE